MGAFSNKQSAFQMGTNCAQLLTYLFLYLYEAGFIQGLLKKQEKKLAKLFNYSYRYIDDVSYLIK